MSTRNKNKKIYVDEVRELENLNRRTQERFEQMEKFLTEREARAAYRRVMAERHLIAFVKAVAIALLSCAVCATLGVLMWQEAISVWFGIPCAFATSIVASMRCGWLWHEVKDLEVRL